MSNIDETVCLIPPSLGYPEDSYTVFSATSKKISKKWEKEGLLSNNNKDGKIGKGVHDKSVSEQTIIS